MKRHPAVIALPGIVVAACAFGFWYMREQWLNKRMLCAMNDARQIYAATHYTGDDDWRRALKWDPADRWPRSDAPARFQTSTQFLQWLMENKIFSVEPNFFSEPGLPPGRGDELKSECNAWCVVELSGHAPDAPDIPILFSRNLKITRLDDPVEGALSDEPPFGRRGVVLITHRGRSHVLRGEKRVIEFFTGINATNRVLRP